MQYAVYIAAAYGIAALVLGAVIIQSILAWRQSQRADKPDA